MLLFAVAHALQLEDGTYAIRSPEFPGCETRSVRVELAREQFGEVLAGRVLEMIEAGEVPLLHSYEELAASFAGRCSAQLPAADRMAGTFDRVLAVRAKLPPEAAARLERIRAAPPRELYGSDAECEPSGEAAPAPDTSSADDEERAQLNPSARLALVAARLTGRDRHLG